MKTNKPVAWIGETLMGRQYINGQKSELPVGTPIYTHPVNPKYDPETGEPLIDGYPLFSGLPHPVQKPMMVLDGNRVYPAFKELTDAEILEELLIPKSEWNSYKAHHCLKQIRAILRKAQEK